MGEIEGPLERFLNKKISEVVDLGEIRISNGQKERHRIFSLMLMAITYGAWNGNRYGIAGEYPMREKQKTEGGLYREGTYLGHNIAAIAVDGDGRVIDFDFNHNAVFNSSMEHAEARLVRRVFDLAQVYESWNMADDQGLDNFKGKTYSRTLDNVTLYTTLESCYQCSGIMALARVKEVVYLQDDHGMFKIGNILRKFTERSFLKSPLPICGAEFDFKYYDRLNQGLVDFRKKTDGGQFFYIAPDGKNKVRSGSTTTYLCSDDAYVVFEDAYKEFDNMTGENLRFPEYKPRNRQQVLTNVQALYEAKSFLKYAIEGGRRGSPHK